MDKVSLFMQTLTAWHWIGFAVVLMIIELIGCAGFLFWISLSAAVVGVVVWAVPSLLWPYQLFLFALGGILSSLLWWRHLKLHPSKTDKPLLNKRSAQYIGRTFSLEEAIINGRGRIKVDDSLWRIEGEDLPVGTQVTVTDVDGVILKVEAAAQG